ncbi:MAG: DUF2169 domain-containing protein [Polyangiaceae bacterium]|nr:DUF2169 domain-containing protein [Polyangiaceae bacterium]
MDIRSEGPLRVGSLLFVDSQGRWVFTAIAKATFDITPGTSPLVSEGGDPVYTSDLTWGGDPTRSLRHASDLVPFKRSPEVLLIGSAYTPGGRSLPSLTVRLSVAEVDKAIEVYGERCFNLDGELSATSEWTRMNLRWERAAGGPDTSNPVGIVTGPDATADPWGRFHLPHLWPPWQAPPAPREVVPPIGYGPIAPHWPERRLRLYQHAHLWDQKRLFLQALPLDFNELFFNAAPRDQFVLHLDGDESLTLENLHPQFPNLTTRLARIAPKAVMRSGASSQSVQLTCDTLTIDTDRSIATLTYRGHVVLHQKDQPGTVAVRLQERTTTVTLSTGSGPTPSAQLPFQPKSETPAAAAPQAPTHVRRPRVSTVTLPPDSTSSQGPLPFQPSTGAPPNLPKPPADVAKSNLSTITLPPIKTARVESTLPFQKTGENIPAQPPKQGYGPVEEMEEIEVDPDPSAITLTPITYVGEDEFTSDSLPLDGELDAGDQTVAFSGQSTSAEPALPLSWTGQSPTILSDLLTTPPLPVKRGVVPPSVPASLTSPPLSVEPSLTKSGSLAQALHAKMVEQQHVQKKTPVPPPFVPPPTSAGGPAVPPPLLGPLASSVESAPPPPSEPNPRLAAPEPEVAEPLPLNLFSIEKCAQIAAQIDHTPSKKSTYLEEVSLTLTTWARLSDHYRELVSKELARNKSTHLKKEDAAYVAWVEQNRGPISAQEYAHLCITADLTDPAAELQKLHIAAQAWPRIKRVWTAKMAKDPKLFLTVRSLMDSE